MHLESLEEQPKREEYLKQTTSAHFQISGGKKLKENW